MSTFRMWYRSQPVALRTLIAVNVVFYLAWLLLLGNVGATAVFVRDHLALNPGLPGVLLEAWQLLTYNFLHFGFFHVLFNMLWLWWIGREFEDLHGPHQMLALYLIGGVGGGLLSVLGYALTSSTPPYIIGASASVLAVMAAVVTLYPQKKIRLLFIGTVRLLWVVVAFLALNVLFAVDSNTAVLAHLGGAGAGYLFVRAERSGMDLTSWAKVFFSGRSRSSSGYTPGRGASSSGSSSSGSSSSGSSSSGSSSSGSSSSGSSSSGSSAGGGFFGGLFGKRGSGAAGRRSSRHETLRQERDRKKAQQSARRREVDRILDKISAEGYDALSDEEKRTLEDASRQ